ncbi:MAG: hypothetical protein KGP12_04205 [Actinomycetales bacterium]|nr:hypothetical protein [Actinomycetales bacterium]
MTTLASDLMTQTDDVLLLDAQGHCQWASASLARTLGFDPVRAGRIRVSDEIAGLHGVTTALTGDAGALMRMRTATGAHAWFTARGVIIPGSTADGSLLLLRMRPVPVEDQARAALRAARRVDEASGLLTRASLVDRLAHPACDGHDHRALVLLQAAEVADTPWGPRQCQLGRALRIMGEAARRQARDLGHDVPVLARFGPDEVALTIRGIDEDASVASLARSIAMDAQCAIRAGLDVLSARVTPHWQVRRAGQPWTELLQPLLGSAARQAC